MKDWERKGKRESKRQGFLSLDPFRVFFSRGNVVSSARTSKVGYPCLPPSCWVIGPPANRESSIHHCLQPDQYESRHQDAHGLARSSMSIWGEL